MEEEVSQIRSMKIKSAKPTSLCTLILLLLLFVLLFLNESNVMQHVLVKERSRNVKYLSPEIEQHKSANCPCNFRILLLLLIIMPTPSSLQLRCELTPWNKILLQNLTAVQFKKFPSFYAT